MAGECGHVNRHSYDYQGNLDNLECTQEKGHGGDHSAMHFERGTRFSTEMQDTSAFKYMRACKKCKKFVSGEKSYCQECFEPFPEKTPHYYEGEILVHWNAAAGRLASEIVPDSPGIEIIPADRSLFPEQQYAKEQEMEKRLAELEKKLEERLIELEKTPPSVDEEVALKVAPESEKSEEATPEESSQEGEGEK